MLDEMATPAVRTERRVRPTPSKTQIGQIVFTIPAARALRAAVGDLGAGREQPRRRDARLDFLPTVSWWWVAGRLAAAGRGPGPDGADGRRRADPAAPRRTRATTRAEGASTCGCGWPSASPTSSAPPTSPAPPGCRPTPGPARCQGRQAGRPALDPSRDRDAHPRQRLLDRARGRPLRSLARRRRAAHRPDQGRRRCPRRHPQHAVPGAVVGRDAEVAPGLRGDRPGHEAASTGPVRPPSPSGAPAGRGREKPSGVQAASGWWRTPPSRLLISLLPDRGRARRTRRRAPVGA